MVRVYDEGVSYTATCQMSHCVWMEQWSNRHAAGCAGSWHVYDHHKEEWVALFGDREPRDPRPESVGVRYG